jgi:hypothetical protein
LQKKYTTQTYWQLPAIRRSAVVVLSTSAVLIVKHMKCRCRDELHTHRLVHELAGDLQGFRGQSGREHTDLQPATADVMSNEP